MSFISKALKAGAAAVTLTLAGGGVAQAQQTQTDPRIVTSQINIENARLRASVASCNRYQQVSNFAQISANREYARACEARERYYHADRVTNILFSARYYNEAATTANNAMSLRVRWDDAQLRSNVARCDAQYSQSLSSARGFDGYANASSNQRICRENAQVQFYQAQANTEQYSANMQERFARLAPAR